MSIVRHAPTLRPEVVSPETMYRAVCRLGIVPFFENPITGWSVEELTPPRFWFDGDGPELGPWDWKIDCVQSGDIAYGKFLWGGKAAFATVEWYRELMNYRRSLPKYTPTADQQKILDFLAANGSVSIKEVRGLLGVKKGPADAQITKLMMQCRVVTGDITRVYRGEDLHYNGWQVSSFCSPEGLFETEAEPLPGASLAPSFPSGFPFESVSLRVDHSPAESLRRLVEHIKEVYPAAPEALVLKALG